MEPVAQKSTDRRFCVATFLYLMVLFQGICIYSFYATIIDFTEIFETSVEAISCGISLRFLGVCIGSMAGGLIFKLGEKLTICAIFLAMEGAMPLLIPQVPNMILFYLCKFCIGFSNGIVKSGAIIAVSEMWKENSGPFVQGIELIELLSSIVAPLAFRPYLSDGTPTGAAGERSNNTPSSINETTTVLNTTAEVFVQLSRPESQLWIPLSVLGTAMMTVASSALFYQCCIRGSSTPKTRGDGKSEQVSDPNEKEEERRPTTFEKLYPIGVIGCAMTLISLIQILFTPFYSYWTFFIMQSDLKLTKATGVAMLSSFSAAMTVSSCLGVLLSMKFEPLITVFCLLTLQSVGTLTNLLYVNTSEVMLWVGGSLLSLGYGCFGASTFNIVQRRLPITPTTGSLYMFFCYLVPALGIPVLIGYYIQKNAAVLIYVSFAAILCMFVFLGLIFVLDTMKARRDREVESNKCRNAHFVKPAGCFDQLPGPECPPKTV